MGAQSSRGTILTIGGAAVVVVALGLGAHQLSARRASAQARPVRPSSSRAPGPVLRVPHLPGSITLDGDTDDPGWTQSPGPARTGPFVLANGAEARPYSNARALWGDGHLYLALYAADEDIRTRTDQPDGPLWLDDAFRLTFTRGDVEYAIDVSPKGVITDAVRRSGGAFDYSWSAGAHVSPELDGTINESSNMDEEWVIEMAIPFESLGLKGESGETFGFTVRRCDTPKGEARVCAGWGEGSPDEEPGRIVLE
jgi:hypothetical protein